MASLDLDLDNRRRHPLGQLWIAIVNDSFEGTGCGGRVRLIGEDRRNAEDVLAFESAAAAAVD